MMDKFIEEYTETTNMSKEDAYLFLVKNKRKFSKPLFKEAILNFRVIYCHNQKNKIFNSYAQNIIPKTIFHKSDLAIGHNILKYVNLPHEQNELILEYLYNRIKEFLPKNISYKLKKFYVLNYIYDNILIYKN